MLLSEFLDFNKWTVSKDVFYLNEERSFKREDLIEDMFQASIGNLVLDVGWYGEYLEENGCFRVYVIIDFNWEKPFYELIFSENEYDCLIDSLKEIVLILNENRHLDLLNFSIKCTQKK